MKRFLFFTLVLLCLHIPTVIYAQDFEYTIFKGSGMKPQNLVFTVLDEKAKTCAVKSNSPSLPVNGEVSIPSIAKHNGEEYSVISIDTGAFYRCEGITSVNIPESVIYIGEGAFLNCWELTSVNIPETVKYIGEQAFSYTDLTAVKIPSSVTSIAAYTFENCRKLTTVDLPNSLTSIGGCAFYGCSLTSVDIPGSVKSIGSYAFAFTKLTSLNIPNSVTSIGGYAFVGCSELASLNIPESVNIIGKGAFVNCRSLISVYIPSSVTTMYRGCFQGCSSLKEIKVSQDNPYLCDIDGVLYSKDKTQIVQCPGGRTSVTIPTSVTSISNAAFWDCSKLKDIFVESNNSYYEDLNGVLYTKGIKDLIACPGARTSLSIPNTVTRIEDCSLAYCDKLTSINIPNSVVYVGEYAFYSCEELISVDIPESVLLIGEQCFKYCFNLENVLIRGSITSINNEVFHYCKKLTSVTIPESVTFIGDSAFEGCESLSSINLPKSLFSIGERAFGGSGLTSVTIPGSVASIGSLAFRVRPLINRVDSFNPTPPEMDNYDVFYSEVYDMAVLHVLKGAKEEYMTAFGWSNFCNIIDDLEKDNSGIEEINDTEDSQYPMEFYNLNGIKAGDCMEALTPGIYIVRQGSKISKLVIN